MMKVNFFVIAEIKNITPENEKHKDNYYFIAYNENCAEASARYVRENWSC